MAKNKTPHFTLHYVQTTASKQNVITYVHLQIYIPQFKGFSNTILPRQVVIITLGMLVIKI